MEVGDATVELRITHRRDATGWFEVESDTIVEKYFRLHLQGILAYQISLVSHGNN